MKIDVYAVEDGEGRVAQRHAIQCDDGRVVTQPEEFADKSSLVPRYWPQGRGTQIEIFVFACSAGTAHVMSCTHGSAVRDDTTTRRGGTPTAACAAMRSGGRRSRLLTRTLPDIIY